MQEYTVLVQHITFPRKTMNVSDKDEDRNRLFNIFSAGKINLYAHNFSSSLFLEKNEQQFMLHTTIV